MPAAEPAPSPKTGLLWRAEQVYVLAAATWRESLRRRLVLVGLILSLAFVVLYGLGVYFIFRSLPADALTGDMGDTGLKELAAYQLLSFGMFVASFLGTMILVFSAAGMITGDAENGTLQTIVVRPVSRGQILAGRSLGYVGLFLIYIVVVASSLILLTQAFGGIAPSSPVEAVVFLAFQGLVILGLATLGSTALSPVATGLLALMAYGLSFIGGVVEQVGTLAQSDTAAMVGKVVTHIVPSDRLFRMALSGLVPSLEGPLSQIQSFGPFGAPVGPDLLGILYALGYVAVCFVVAGFLFARKDL